MVRDTSVLTHWRVPLSGGRSGQYYGPQTKLSGGYSNYLIKSSTYYGDLENCISQAEAARIRGVSNQAIADLIARGRLTTVHVAGKTLVLRSEVESFVPQPKLGRPPKKTAVKKSTKKTPKK